MRLRTVTGTLPVVPDSVAGLPGPLAGVLAALEWTLARREETRFVVTAAGDKWIDVKLPDGSTKRLAQKPR